ncbi:MAG: DapA [Candidatus Magnetoglobus multicellularis str. Araruama]|uniref:4-hydroxy-tetrahydrodipicolinate synthase n=1 Tax=Candidatus Magnetoglobus multicellularis str. Araruama TaxID=890399 RepID=A0A1V1P956_9BACT|nr:MAG: DapA [Candidatus Magnetoglobus multicellularis str. Araruama]
MFKGCYTALITPFIDEQIDMNGLDQLVSFQIENNVAGIVAVGTTGESPTLIWDEHNTVIKFIADKTQSKCACIAGTGSNNTKEAINAVRHAAVSGVSAVLLVDPYYNGPSSLEIRKEYYEPIAQKFPDLPMIPYIIPGRTGTQLLPEDLAILKQSYSNVKAVKEATGDFVNMKKTRQLCGVDFGIISGDDDKTCQMMTEPDIQASGVISVIANIAPRAVQDMVNAYEQKDYQKGEQLQKALSPLFKLVSVVTTENTPFGPVTCRARNPLPCKTLMQILGMPSGPCRQPTGKMTQNGISALIAAARTVNEKNPEIFAPLADFFNVNIDERLSDNKRHLPLTYTDKTGQSVY